VDGVFETMALPDRPDTVAPDGSHVRVLPGLAAGGFAHFELPASAVSVAVHHRTVEEIWFVTGGQGRIWRRRGSLSRVDRLVPGVSATIPLGTDFQFRATGDEPLTVVACTMPPWPGAGEAVRSDWCWEATVEPGPGLAEPDVPPKRVPEPS
jgi:mannose-6-phosphate isomerase-like protein (cupin superfamily)